MANIIRRHSRPLLSDLQEEINRLFNLTIPSSEKNFSEILGDFAPAIDIQDEKDHYLVKADIPGVDPKDISIEMHNNTLTIRGEKESKTEEKKENYVRVERSKGLFYRTIELPESVEADKIKASSHNGVLKVTIPKSKAGASRKIEVEAH